MRRLDQRTINLVFYLLVLLYFAACIKAQQTLGATLSLSVVA